MSLNTCALVGRLGADAELRYTKDGVAVATFRVATSETYKGIERTDWHKVDVWGKQAEAVAPLLTKGRLVGVTGAIRYDEWVDKDNEKKWSTKIRAQSVQLLDAKPRDREKPAVADEPFVADDSDVPFGALLPILLPALLGLIA